MTTAFDRAEYPTQEPVTLAAGDRWTWKRTDLGAVYSTSLYTLSYQLIRHGDDQVVISITAAADGADYIVEVASATTTSYRAGTYVWTSLLTRDSDSERIRLGTGSLEVLDDPAATDVADPRTYAQQQVDTLRESLARLSAQDISSFSVADRSRVRKSMLDVRRELHHWEQRRSAEINVDRIRRGKKSVNNIRIRF